MLAVALYERESFGRIIVAEGFGVVNLSMLTAGFGLAEEMLFDDGNETAEVGRFKEERGKAAALLLSGFKAKRDQATNTHLGRPPGRPA